MDFIRYGKEHEQGQIFPLKGYAACSASTRLNPANTMFSKTTESFVIQAHLFIKAHPRRLKTFCAVRHLQVQALNTRSESRRLRKENNLKQGTPKNGWLLFGVNPTPSHGRNHKMFVTIYIGESNQKPERNQNGGARSGVRNQPRSAQYYHSMLWMDAIHFAPPKKPCNDECPVNTMASSMVSKWRAQRISQPSTAGPLLRFLKGSDHYNSKT